ncbi:esterase/lipase family protein [Thermomonas sp.]
MSNRVLLVHGLWMRSFSMRWLATRLRGQGFQTELFGYYSLLQDTDAVVARLAGVMAQNPGANVVAHSLGGLLSLRAAELAGIAGIGRIVCLGSPLAGSQAAANIVARIPAGASLVGHNRALLAAGIDHVPAGLQVGAVAGCVPRGLGGVVAHFACEHDGTVAIAETRVPGLADHAVVRASHSGLLFSDAAARRSTEFLRHGRFQHASAAGVV